MADESKIGSDWTDEELDLIVADYFAMLRAEQDGEHYVKAVHRRALMEQIGRTKRSVEFKHMNISAVLRELGIPWIDGYRPKPNYQRSIFAAIDRYLSDHPHALEFHPAPVSGLSARVEPFIEPPPALSAEQPPRQEPLERLVRKFDPVERDFRNRRLGKAGKEFIFEFESCAKGPVGLPGGWRWSRIRYPFVRPFRSRAADRSEDHLRRQHNALLSYAQ